MKFQMLSTNHFKDSRKSVIHQHMMSHTLIKEPNFFNSMRRENGKNSGHDSYNTDSDRLHQK